MNIKIKLLIADEQQAYINSILNFYQNRYTNKLEVYACTNAEALKTFVNTQNFDVLLATQTIDLKGIDLSMKGFAYLVESPGIADIEGKRAIFKYQNADAIYKEILSVYAESGQNANASIITTGAGKGQVVAFHSCGGGTGCSTIAVAFAKKLAKQLSSVLYLSFELWNNTDIYFATSSKYTLTDIIYGLKSKRQNLQIKIESCVSKDSSGVQFFKSCINPIDSCELDDDDIQTLITALKASNNYDYIVIDLGNVGMERFETVTKIANINVLVTDSKTCSQYKQEKMVKAIELMGLKKQANYLSKFCVFHNKTAEIKYPVPNISVVGHVQNFGALQPKDAAEKIANANCFYGFRG